MSARLPVPHPRQLALLGGTAITIIATVSVASGRAAAPAPCLGAPQITDPSGDGHHTSSDVLAAWLSEAAGRLQAVIQVRSGSWLPAHDDAEIDGSGFVMTVVVGGVTRFVRATAAPSGAVSYDYGTYTPPYGFASEGGTTGTVDYGVGGTVTIDVPAALGVAAGATLARPFVLTYDGINADGPDWVDHAPGGDAFDDPAVGADYVVGACGAPAPPPGPAGPGGTPATSGPAPITAVLLSAPSRLKGGGQATISGRVVPARGGVPVALTRRTTVPRTLRLTTAADGGFRTTLPVKEITQVRAVAGAIGSQTLTIDVLSTVRITTRRLPGGDTQVRGVVRPALPGKALLLRAGSSIPTVTKPVPTGVGRFTLRLPSTTRRGRYQVVFLPSRARAERATSNTGVIR
jgi:hypothetical protein